MDLVTISEAARLIGVNASALRYYEERGLVTPTRRAGRRMYDLEQLRRLAFVQIMRALGASLATAAAVLDEPSQQWRTAVRDQVTALDELIARAEGARNLLRHALECPADHPVRECPNMIEVLDRRLDGVTMEQLAADHSRHHTPQF